MTIKLPAADVFIKAAADLSGRDPGQLDEQEAVFILQEYGQEPQGDLYRQLTIEAAGDLFSDPQHVAEWQEVADDWDGEMPDGIAFALQRDLSPIIREKAAKLYDELPQDDPQRDELKKIAIEWSLPPDVKEAIQQAVAVTQSIDEYLRPAVRGISELYEKMLPTIEGLQGIAAAAGGLLESIGATGTTATGIDLSEMFENWTNLRESMAELLANNPTFVLYDRLTKGDLAPYMAEELAKPEYEGKTIEQLFEDAETDEDGEFLETSLLMRAIRAAQEAAAAAKEEIPTITASGRVDNVDFPIDKPNSRLWTLLTKADAGGQLAIDFEMATEKDKRRGKKVPLSYSINFEALGDDLPQVIKRLTVYDKRVYIAVSALFNAGGLVVSPSQIYHAMGYTGECGSTDAQKILTSVKKMAKAWIYINNSYEAQVYKRYLVFDYDGYLLPCEFRPAYINGKYTDTAIWLYREPPLITFARQRRQITTIDVALLQSPVSKTDANMRIEDYLLERISRAQNEDDKKKKADRARQCRILFKTLYERCGIPNKPATDKEKKEKQRAPKKIAQYLDHYVSTAKPIGAHPITQYDKDRDGITVYW